MDGAAAERGKSIPDARLCQQLQQLPTSVSRRKQIPANDGTHAYAYARLRLRQRDRCQRTWGRAETAARGAGERTVGHPEGAVGTTGQGAGVGPKAISGGPCWRTEKPRAAFMELSRQQAAAVEAKGDGKGIE